MLSPPRADWLLVYLLCRHFSLTVRSCFSRKLDWQKWHKGRRRRCREKVSLTLSQGSCLHIFGNPQRKIPPPPQKKKKKFSLDSAKTNNLHFFSRKNFALIRCRNMRRYEPNEENSFLIDIKWLPCVSHPQIVCEFLSSHARRRGSSRIMSQGGHQTHASITHHSSWVRSLCLVS